MERIFWFFKEIENVFQNSFLLIVRSFNMLSVGTPLAGALHLREAKELSLGCRYFSSPSRSSTSRQSDWSSLIRTLNDSGSPGSRVCLPLTMASYILVRPATSSD